MAALFSVTGFTQASLRTLNIMTEGTTDTGTLPGMGMHLLPIQFEVLFGMALAADDGLVRRIDHAVLVGILQMIAELIELGLSFNEEISAGMVATGTCGHTGFRAHSMINGHFHFQPFPLMTTGESGRGLWLFYRREAV
jgi:hypothetical protein